MEKNKLGLPRYIPAHIRKVVRQRCGFGCVLCGKGIYNYEHFDPEFKDAQIHSADGMTLLCPQCHMKKTNGWISKETVIEANKNPKCKEKGFANESFDFGLNPPEIKLAGISFNNCEILIQVNDSPLLSIRKPEAINAPYRLSGLFNDPNGQLSLKIDDNQWFAKSDNWDVEVRGASLKVSYDIRRVSLSLRAEPPSKLVIEKIDMNLEGFNFQGDENNFKICSPRGKLVQFTRVGFGNCHIGILVKNKILNNEILGLPSLNAAYVIQR